MIGCNNIQLELENKPRHKQNRAAFTLIEVLISVTLFAVIVLAVTGLFKLSIDAQRNAIATQNVQESLKYFLEVTAKEIRMAQRDDGACSSVEDDKIFYLNESETGDTLFFKNYYGECVSYYITTDSDNNSRFGISRGLPSETPATGFISPAKINISDLNFVLRETASSSQPMVTINLRANAIDGQTEESEMVLQTSITSRYYKNYVE